MASLRNFRLPFGSSLYSLQKWVTPPIFDEDEKTRQAGLVYLVLLISLASLVVTFLVGLLLPARERYERYIALAFFGTALLFDFFGFYLIRRGQVRLVGLALVNVNWCIIALAAYTNGGLVGPSIFAEFWVIVLAGLLLGNWGAPVYGSLTLLFAIFLYYKHSYGGLPTPLSPMGPEGYLLGVMTITCGLMLLLYLVSRSLRDALDRARQSNRALTEALAKKEQAEAALQQLNLSLEEQVRLRTADLELANHELKLLHEQAEKTAVIEERHRLARELHDSTCQLLAAQTLIAEAGLQMIRQGDLQRSAENLTRVRDVAQEVHRDMRLLLYELRPPLLEEHGLAEVLRQRLERVERRTGVEVSLAVEDNKLPAPVEEALYRVAYEALNNASKHASATVVKVLIRTEGERVELEVTDNGKGFDLEEASLCGGLGLMTMRERVEKLGGTLTVISSPGRGTQLKATLKLDEHLSVAG